MRARANGKKNKGKSKGNISTRKCMRSPKKGGTKGKKQKSKKRKKKCHFHKAPFRCRSARQKKKGKNGKERGTLFPQGPCPLALNRKQKEEKKRGEEHRFHKAPVRCRPSCEERSWFAYMWISTNAIPYTRMTSHIRVWDPIYAYDILYTRMISYIRTCHPIYAYDILYTHIVTGIVRDRGRESEWVIWKRNVIDKRTHSIDKRTH